MSPPTELAGARLLIVDDTPQNLRLISDFLAEQGFELMLTRSGQQALEKIRLGTPDLVLLDVRMPGMDGFEVCRRLKAEPAVADIPVIFMTALDDTSHKVEGFRLGAVDYVTKPIQREELVARIRNHLQLHRLQRELLSQSADLAAKNADLEAYAHTIAHSLKTPLATANRFLEILHKYKSAELSEETRRLVQQAFEAMAMTGEAVDALLLLSTVAQQSVSMQPIDMQAVVSNVQSQLADLVASTHAVIELPPGWPSALGYAPWVGEVWLNLLSNALKYGGVPPRIALGATQEGTQVRFWVCDNGKPLSEEERARVFTPFTRLQSERAAGHGLGLATVQRIVSKLGGRVGAGVAPGGGNEFFFSLPAGSEQHIEHSAPTLERARSKR
jgi:two-component system, sensor histidine kinase and response regulator